MQALRRDCVCFIFICVICEGKIEGKQCKRYDRKGKCAKDMTGKGNSAKDMTGKGKLCKRSDRKTTHVGTAALDL